jgi:hypothetical protein
MARLLQPWCFEFFDQLTECVLLGEMTSIHWLVSFQKKYPGMQCPERKGDGTPPRVWGKRAVGDSKFTMDFSNHQPGKVAYSGDSLPGSQFTNPLKPGMIEIVDRLSSR